ncbi:MAG: hypothetical protein AAFQ64_20040 [Pseudomonadota bacterium]
MRTGTNRSEFVARDGELEFLSKFVRDAVVENGGFAPSVFLLQAPSGAGKSRLVDECFLRFDEIVHLRVDLRQHHSFRGFRSEFLQTIVLHYRAMIRSGEDENLSSWMWSAPRNQKSVADAFASLADGVTFGGVSAVRSLLSVVNSKKSAHIEELFAEQNQLEDWIEKLIIDLGRSFHIAVSVSNAQELNADDLKYLIETCQRANHFLTLEFTTEGFQHGVIDRELASTIVAETGSKAAALVLGPLSWDDARQISRHIGESDDWARDYYERHGFNLFDLKNLTDPSALSYSSVCLDDIEFGPNVLPGIRNRFPASRRKIDSLSREQKFILCLVQIHGGSARKEDVREISNRSPMSLNIEEILSELVDQHELLRLGGRNQEIRFEHDSLKAAIEDCLDLLPLMKIAARQWQTHYKKKFDAAERVLGGTGPAFEDSIRLAYYSALTGSNDTLLDACQAIYGLSRFVAMKGSVKATFKQILGEVGFASMVPHKLQPVIGYYLCASAINFQDLHLANEVISTLEADRFGVAVLRAFIFQRQDDFAASQHSLDEIWEHAGLQLDPKDMCLLELLKVINQHSTSTKASEIEEAKLAYRALAAKSKEPSQLRSLVLKHASIGYGFRESLPLLNRSISDLETNGNAFEAAQAKLVLLMQLTRLGELEQASKVLNEIRDAFPKNFAEEANLLNIEGLINCFVFNQTGESHAGTRELFLRAQRVSNDEYRSLVVASNLFAYDHFIDQPDPEKLTRKSSLDNLVYLLENSTIGFRYLYVLGYYNIMRYYELIDNSDNAAAYRTKIGVIDESDSLLWRCAMGREDPTGTEVEFLVSTPYMLAFLPNYHVPPPAFEGRVDRISEIISR